MFSFAIIKENVMLLLAECSVGRKSICKVFRKRISVNVERRYKQLSIALRVADQNYINFLKKTTSEKVQSDKPTYDIFSYQFMKRTDDILTVLMYNFLRIAEIPTVSI